MFHVEQFVCRCEFWMIFLGFKMMSCERYIVRINIEKIEQNIVLVDYVQNYNVIIELG